MKGDVWKYEYDYHLREDKADGEEECGLSDQLHKADVETQMRQVGK